MLMGSDINHIKTQLQLKNEVFCISSKAVCFESVFGYVIKKRLQKRLLYIEKFQQ